jgi:hypothetical protein
MCIRHNLTAKRLGFVSAPAEVAERAVERRQWRVFNDVNRASSMFRDEYTYEQLAQGAALRRAMSIAAGE